MKLNYELKDAELAASNSVLNGDELLYCVPYDINELGEYVKGYILVTKDYFFFLADCVPSEKYMINDYDEYFLHKGIGCGFLEGRWDEITADDTTSSNENPTDKVVIGKTKYGEQVKKYKNTKNLVRFGTGYMPAYTAITRILNEIRKDGSTRVIGEYIETICPKCGRPYVWGTTLCRNCSNSLEGIKKIVKLVNKYWFALGVIMFLYIVTAFVNLVQPMIYRNLVDNYLEPINPDGTNGIMLCIAALVAFSIGMTLYNVFRARAMSRIGLGIARDLRKTVFEKIHSLSLEYLDERRAGDLMHRVTDDTSHLQNFISQDLTWGLNQIVTLFIVGFVIFFINWQMALLIVAPMPMIIFFMRWVNTKYRTIYHNQWRYDDKCYSTLQDILSGIKVVKVFGMEEKEVGRYADYSLKLANIMAKNEKTYNTYQPLLSFFVGSGSFLVTLYAGSMILNGNMTVGEMIQFSSYAGILYGPIGWVTFFPRALTRAITSAERIIKVLEEEPKVKQNDDIKLENIEGRVCLNDVTFGYKSYEPVLKNINLTVDPGEMIGLVGHSGSGKSTLINLIMRLYDPDEGNITVDGNDLRLVQHDTLRKHIGVVLQETFLFTGTILQNIRYSKPDATLSEVIEAAKVANAHNFIVKFPDGYDTLVGERGQRLSGGERQRIAIARAILNDPKILILDEATASVDTETEQQIQEALGRLIKSRTTFAIAHRLSTLRNANRLLVIEKGEMIELGSHEELMRKKGRYYELVTIQSEMHKVRGYS